MPNTMWYKQKDKHKVTVIITVFIPNNKHPPLFNYINPKKKLPTYKKLRTGIGLALGFRVT